MLTFVGLRRNRAVRRTTNGQWPSSSTTFRCAWIVVQSSSRRGRGGEKLFDQIAQRYRTSSIINSVAGAPDDDRAHSKRWRTVNLLKMFFFFPLPFSRTTSRYTLPLSGRFFSFSLTPLWYSYSFPRFIRHNTSLDRYAVMHEKHVDAFTRPWIFA
jgi:hypothetical protein